MSVAALLRQASGLALASVAAQLMGIASLALIARTFTPADIGAYQVLLSCVAIVSAFQLLAFPVLLAHIDETEVGPLVRALVVLTAAAAAAIGLGFLAFGYWAPLQVACLAASSALVQLSEMANIRRSKFGPIAANRVGLSLSLLAVAATFWSVSIADVRAFIWAQVAVSATIALVYAAGSLGPVLAGRAGDRDALAVLRSRIRTPLFVLSGNTLSALAYNLPLILIERHFGAGMAAQYGMVLRFCFGPVTLVGDSVSKVFHGRLGAAVRNGSDAATMAGYRALRNTLAAGGIAVAVLIYFALPPLLALILGPGWEQAGEFCRILSPLFGIMVAIAPLTVAFLVFEAHRLLLSLHAANFLIALGAFALGIALDSIHVALGAYCAAASLRYLAIAGTIQRMMRMRFAPEARRAG